MEALLRPLGVVNHDARSSAGGDGLSADRIYRPERRDGGSHGLKSRPTPQIDPLRPSSGVADASSAEPSGMEPLLAHQSRESAVSCSQCGRSTWEFHAKCVACGPTSCERCAPV